MYKVYNDLNRHHVCTFYENNGVYTAELIEADPALTLFSTFDIETGKFNAGARPNPESKYIEYWLEDRVIPSNRDMLKETLAKLGIYEYDWRELIKLNHGRSVEDYFSVEVCD